VSLAISDCVLLSASTPGRNGRSEGHRFPGAHIFANIIARRNAAAAERRHGSRLFNVTFKDAALMLPRTESRLLITVSLAPVGVTDDRANASRVKRHVPLFFLPHGYCRFSPRTKREARAFSKNASRFRERVSRRETIKDRASGAPWMAVALLSLFSNHFPRRRQTSAPLCRRSFTRNQSVTYDASHR